MILIKNKWYQNIFENPQLTCRIKENKCIKRRRQIKTRLLIDQYLMKITVQTTFDSDNKIKLLLEISNLIQSLFL